MKLTDGFLNLLKPPGMTSHDVVSLVRRGLAGPRIGHLGTLDPAAAGVLPVAVGRATRLFQFASGVDKAYRAEIVFGITTDTLDAAGRVTAEADAGRASVEQVRAIIPRFLGEIVQTPPAYSAVHVGGKRLHELARRGEALAGQAAVAAAKQVRIGAIELISFSPGAQPRALLDVVCSHGTYLRSLAADLGQALGCGAYLSFLVRTRVGRFALADTLTLEEFSHAAATGGLTQHLLSCDWPLTHLPSVMLEGHHAKSFATGGRVLTQHPPAAAARVYRVAPGGTTQNGADRALLGIGEVLPGGQLRPRLVLSSAEGEPQ